MVRRKRIRSLVEQLLQDCQIRRPPVDVEHVAKHLGLLIKRAKTDDAISGFIHRASASDPVVIGVNASHAQTRQRFTIAHEIGHHLLHAAANFHVDGPFRVYWRDPKSAEGSDRSEIEANIFAAELLVPYRFITAELLDLGAIDLDDEARLRRLAQRYLISSQAMIFRLVNLGYLQA